MGKWMDRATRGGAAAVTGGQESSPATAIHSSTTREQSEQTNKANPPDDPLSNRIRAQLLRWGGPRHWPALPEDGLEAGAQGWSDWLTQASVVDLGIAWEHVKRRQAAEAPTPQAAP